MKRLQLLLFLFFFVTCYSCLIASNHSPQNDEFTIRFYEFIELIQMDITTFPYKKIDNFLKVSKEYERLGERWISLYKDEKAGKYKISFRRSKNSGEKEFKFGTLKFVSKKIDDSKRVYYYNNVKTIFLKKYGDPSWDKSYKNGKVARTLWWLEIKDKSRWSLMLVTSGIGQNKGNIEIVLNRKPLKAMAEED